jgi:hypothetical protein
MNLEKRIIALLEANGVLLLTDSKMPSLTTIVAGKPVQGSWWGHPQGSIMYNLSISLLDRPHVLAVKLIDGKVTFVHQRLWNALYAIGSSREDWQTQGLSKEALQLLHQIDSNETLRADRPGLSMTPSEIGKLANRLEQRLLIHSESVHTDSGKHVRLLQTWKAVLKSKRFKTKKTTSAQSKSEFEKITEAFLKEYGVSPKLPWTMIPRKGRRSK